MTTLKIYIEAVLHTSPEKLYEMWLDSEGHEQLTGGEADIRPEVGNLFSTWDGYISGKIVSLEVGKRVLQTWRTVEFAENAKDSVVDIRFERHAEGTLFKLLHTELESVEAVEKYRQGWEDHYIAPMKNRFNA